MMGPNEKALQDSLAELSNIPLRTSREVAESVGNGVLLTSIASSLAIIADKLTEEDWKNDVDKTQ